MACRAAPLVLVLAASLLTGCTGAPPPAVTLRACLWATQDFLPAFVAREQGFDKKNGLHLAEQTYAGGAAAIDAMVAGSLDVCGGTGSVPVLAAVERGLVPDKIMAVAVANVADPGHRALGVVVARSIKTWKDLQGQRVAANARDSITAAGMLARLKTEGVTEYSLVEIPFSNMGLAVAGGNVAAASMNEPFLTQSLLRGDGRLLGWVIGGPPFEHAIFTMVVVRTAFSRQNPESVKAYLRAHLQAVHWINRNSAQARALLVRRLDLSEEVGRSINMMAWPEDARIDPALLERVQPLLIEIGFLRAPIPGRTIYDQTLLEQVLAERR